ncbi:protein NRT1/ PTR FAMILY 2.6-like [Senna tora]|uniref:Protein NRT1/ PTR FAMILY 2.6-like n=1 Tax=Senna tora TaxID=362788 RepID=A0A834WJQ3_9FABA|nr:protein NRT1/ PTR FAMILY 2.6-like [Senna tora]
MDESCEGSNRKRGGWMTFPFITGAVSGFSLASTGMMENVIVYLIKEFNIKSIAAAQTSNIINGCTSFSPLLAALIADSFLGSFTVASISSFVSLLGTILLILSASLKSLRPQPCDDDHGSNPCKSPSSLQYAILYTALALTAIGFGGTRFIMATLGANQFHNKPRDQSVFFNWFFFTLHVGSVASMTIIFYIQTDLSWSLGFGLCAMANLIAMAFLLFGYPFYRHDRPQGSPFVDMARVLVATSRKWRLSQSSSSVKDYYYGGNETLPEATRLRIQNQLAQHKKLMHLVQFCSFFNRAALITEGDTDSEGRIVKPWRLCSVEQVENLKSIIGILPLWSTTIFLSTPIGVLTSLAILQAMAMDRHIGPHFQFPPASVPVATLISTSITLTLLDRLLYPTWHKLVGKDPTALQQIGLGHVFSVLGLAVSAVVEWKRLRTTESLSMSAFWLVPQFVLVGVGVAFDFPGQVGLYYQEFPESLKSTSTAMISLTIGTGSYLSTAVIDVVRRSTDWLPDDINDGRIDNMYWLLVVMGGINFGYFLVCASFYKYQRG